MDTNNGNKEDIKTETVEYNQDNNYYIFTYHLIQNKLL